MGLTLVTEPAVEPLVAADVKARLGWGAEVPDANVTAWIKSERQRLDGADGILGRALITQTWDYTVEQFPCWSRQRPDAGIVVPLPRLQSIESVEYRDGSGDEQTLDPSLYRAVAGERGRVVLKTGGAWPSADSAPDAVTIRFVAGYGSTADKVPEPIKQAITLGVSLSRSMSRDLLVTSEVADGIGRTDYAAGVQAGASIAAQIDRLLAPYRVGVGIS